VGMIYDISSVIICSAVTIPAIAISRDFI
jgi:hypothetical protein